MQRNGAYPTRNGAYPASYDFPSIFHGGCYPELVIQQSFSTNRIN